MYSGVLSITRTLYYWDFLAALLFLCASHAKPTAVGTKSHVFGSGVMMTKAARLLSQTSPSRPEFGSRKVKVISPVPCSVSGNGSSGGPTKMLASDGPPQHPVNVNGTVTTAGPVS